MKEFSFNIKNSFAKNGITQGLMDICDNQRNIAFICIGTDGSIGDSLAPFVGTMLRNDKVSNFVYGTIDNTITAREVPYIEEYLKKAHPLTFCVVIDAAIGNKEDIGLIKIQSEGIKPGLGVNKNLPFVGDAAIIGVVSEKGSSGALSGLNYSRISYVYSMARVIGDAIENFIELRKKNTKTVVFSEQL